MRTVTTGVCKTFAACPPPPARHAPLAHPAAVMTAVLPTTRGLVLVLSLLSLLHVATSLTVTDPHTLEELNRNLQTLEDEVLRKKANHKLDKVLIAEVMDDVINMMDGLEKMVMKLLPHYTSFPEIFKDLKEFMEDSKAFFAKRYEDEAALITDNEEQLRSLKERITSLGEHRTEL